MTPKIPVRNLAKLKTKFPDMKQGEFLRSVFASDMLKRDFFTPDLSVDFGLWIKDSRETRDMTVQELAKMSGVRTTLLKRLENGKVMPECEVMGPIAFVFAMTTDRKNWRTIVKKYGEYKI